MSWCHTAEDVPVQSLLLSLYEATSHKPKILLPEDTLVRHSTVFVFCLS